MGSFSFKTPNLWVALAIFLAVPGMILGSLGLTTGHAWLKVAGTILCVPFAIVAIALIGIVFPILIVANCRSRKRPPQKRKDL